MSMRRRSFGSRYGALLHAFVIGWRESWAQRGALVGMFLTYGVIVSIWANLYRLLPAETLAKASFTYPQVVWYLALTELVAFSIGHAYRDIQDEILDGSMAGHLLRPVGYVALTGAQELGRMAVKIAALAAPGAALAYALSGTIPFRVGSVAPLVASLAAGAAVLLAVQILIGLSTAWLGTSRPLFFIVQKLVFVFGGIVLPLDAYPDALVKIAWLTPFPAMLYAPGSVALRGTFAHAVTILGLQLFWLGAAWLAIAAASAAFERRFVRQGLAS